MIIANATQKTYISKETKELNSLADKSLGLLSKSNPRSVFFETRFGVHTFFLKDAIDVLVLDDRFIVRGVKTVLPNRIFFWNPKYKYIVELPKGTIGKSKTKIGDSIEFIDNK